MLAGLTAARHDWVLFVPCDGPALPLDLMTRFRAAITPDTDLVVAHDGEHLQPVVALLRRALRPSLSQALADGERKTGAWFARHRMAVVPLPICPTPSSTSTARPNSPPGRRGCGKGARHEPPALLGFVAWSGTGKTTLLERLIPRLVARGLRLGVLKHTHHAFDMDQPGKDSHRLRQAGATQVMAASDRRHALIRETPEGAPFEALLARFDASALDLLLVEGFKHRRFPKVELYRAAIGRPLLFPDDPDIVARERRPQATTLPRFPFEDLEAIADFICARLPPHAPVRPRRPFASAPGCWRPCPHRQSRALCPACSVRTRRAPCWCARWMGATTVPTAASNGRRVARPFPRRAGHGAPADRCAPMNRRNDAGQGECRPPCYPHNPDPR
jgi:molybdopterin-guanine dinucleotide biosynthesis protein MobB